jgi:hypothetical protein
MAPPIRSRLILPLKTKTPPDISARRRFHGLFELAQNPLFILPPKKSPAFSRDNAAERFCFFRVFCGLTFCDDSSRAIIPWPKTFTIVNIFCLCD